MAVATAVAVGIAVVLAAAVAYAAVRGELQELLLLDVGSRDGGGVFANAGSWLDAPTYLRITGESIELRSATSESAEGDCLNPVDRRAKEATADA